MLSIVYSTMFFFFYQFLRLSSSQQASSSYYRFQWQTSNQSNMMSCTAGCYWTRHTNERTIGPSIYTDGQKSNIEKHVIFLSPKYTPVTTYIIVLNYDIQDFGSIHYKDFYLYCPEFYPNNCNDKIIDTDES